MPTLSPPQLPASSASADLRLGVFAGIDYGYDTTHWEVRSIGESTCSPA